MSSIKFDSHLMLTITVSEDKHDILHSEAHRIFTSRISGQGYKNVAVCVCVCLSVS